MTCYFVGRHPGAVDWMKKRGPAVDIWNKDFNAEQLKKGDVVYGTLPVHIAEKVCRKGARFVALCLAIPGGLRGTELTAEDLERYGCHLKEYQVQTVA